MADWLKVEYHTPHKTEMNKIAKLCNIKNSEAFHAWFKLYAHFDKITKNGFIPCMSRAMVDKVAGVVGFAVALEQVNWIRIDDKHGLTVVEWGLHNGKQAKRRALDAKWRQRKRAQEKEKNNSDFFGFPLE